MTLTSTLLLAALAIAVWGILSGYVREMFDERVDEDAAE